LNGTQIVGILNVTPDSFSDGNQFVNPEQALLQAIRLFEQGADIIDIGAESTRPGTELIDHLIEWERLKPVLDVIKAHWQNTEHRPVLSIDTRHALTAEKALSYHISWINDQSQAEFAAMVPALKTGLKYIAMHHCGLPPQADKLIQEPPLTVLARFQTEWQERFADYDLEQNQLILDPGIGFGKTVADYLIIFKELENIKTPESQWLIGHSRKSFLKHLFPDMPVAESATAVISGYLGNKNIDYLRVHEPANSIAAIQLANFLY
jgi:dihydropteroate synthase